MMSFWAYMLHCRGGYFYVGHTDNLELRVAQHQTGQVPGFAAEHRPVELVWSEYFQTRDEAKTAEKQIKGWSRAKKLALIRGDWVEGSRLAKGKGSPSTSSGKSGAGEPVSPKTDHPKPVKGPTSHSIPARPELVEGLSLLCHPDTPANGIRSVQARVIHSGDGTNITALIDANPATILLPDAAKPYRADGLWRTTCFEVFHTLPEGGYVEYNFSPSSQWAAYLFKEYRVGMTPLAVEHFPPSSSWSTDDWIADEKMMWVHADVGTSIPLPARIALSAVIEETDGTKSYWALRHPPGPPDFHHPDCFALTLGAPGEQL